MGNDDPRLAILYDLDNPDGPDHDFFRALADRTGAGSIVDLGCGTGLLTVTLTGRGRRVTGIDPAADMLDHARHRPGGDAVTWILGTADRIEPGSADLVVMSGNVAMHIIGPAWASTLDHVAAGLRPGGTLAFETRNPEARAWERWNEDLSERVTPVGVLRESLVTEAPNAEGVVVMHCHNEFDDGTVVDIHQPLQFRDHDQIVHDLDAAGLRVQAIHRTWHQEPFTGGPDQPLMVVVAVRD